jgi:proteasome accessory factor A
MRNLLANGLFRDTRLLHKRRNWSCVISKAAQDARGGERNVVISRQGEPLLVLRRERSASSGQQPVQRHVQRHRVGHVHDGSHFVKDLTSGALERAMGCRRCQNRRKRGELVDRRIFGLENEYGVTCTFRGQRRLSPDEVARYLFRRVVSWGRSSNVFLRNGARLYLDVGSHPEYATPECDSLIDLVTHDKAGERTLEGLLVDAERRLREEGIAGDVYLFKNNTDSAGNSYGCHENYLVGRHGEFSRLADVLIPFLVSRQLICGAGKVLQTPRGAVYSVSQRAEHIWEGVSSATTRSRPIINTRDEPHADAERYRRLHVIVGDSNMSETTTLMKVGATDLVLRMIEAGITLRDLSLENPIRAIREISHDLTGRRKVRLANGRDASGLDIQEEFYSKARDFVDRRSLETPVVRRVLDLWERTLKAIDSGDHSLVEREIDWVIKYRMIERYRHKYDLSLASPRLAQLDLAYHDIHRGRGLYYLLERRGAVARVARDIEIFEAKSVPPQTTRARLRGEFIRRAQERRRDFTVDWVHLKLNDQAQRTVLCKDPFRAVDERVEKLIASM